MGNIFKASLFKMVKDVAFRITLIIGGAFAVIMTGLYFVMDLAFSEAGVMAHYYLNGPSMLINSLSPMQNLGFILPIMLIIFISLEFTQGIVRNKIISGYSKTQIYFGLLFSALVFTFGVLITYVLLCTFLGFVFTGFQLSDECMVGLFTLGNMSFSYLIKLIAVAILTYLGIVTYTVFIVTSFRSVGPCIPLVMVVLMGLYLVASLVTTFASLEELGLDAGSAQTALKVVMILDPLFGLTGGTVVESGSSNLTIDLDVFISCIVNNVVYATIFTVGGALLFNKRDVK